MNKTEFKKTLAVMADDLYAKGFKDGASSRKSLALVHVEESGGSFSWSLRVGIDEHSTMIEIPQSMIDKMAGVV